MKFLCGPALAAFLLTPTIALAHCDGLDGPVVKAAQSAYLGPKKRGTIKDLAKLLESAVQGGLEARFKEVAAKKKFKNEDVAAGRKYVKAYVEFIHYVERLYEAAKNPAEGHFPEIEEAWIAKNPVR